MGALVVSIRSLLDSPVTNAECRNVPLLQGAMGRPRYGISQEQLEHLIDLQFTCPSIAALLGVSLRTIRRRMEEFGIAIRDRYSRISDSELDEEVEGIKRQYPNAGIKMITGASHWCIILVMLLYLLVFFYYLGILRARGYNVQQVRVRDCVRRVDPLGVVLRWAGTIQRRRYHVQGPLSLWHIDGNHKLIRYVNSI